MTVKQAGRLFNVQAERSSNKVFELLNKKGLRANPRLVKKAISEQSAQLVLDAITKNLAISAQKNRTLLTKLINNANAKTNPDFASRQIAVFALNKLVKEGSKSALKGLLAAVSEPNIHLRLIVVNMLSTFAKKDKRVFEGLRQATRDEESNIRITALRGLTYFAGKKDARTFKVALSFIAVRNNSEREEALLIINILASKKYKPAMEFLKKYKGFKRDLSGKSKLTGEF